MQYTLGIDIGGTNIKGGVVTPQGKIIKSISIPAEAQRGKKKFLDNIYRCIDLCDPKKVSAIGIGCPGPLDHVNGIILTPPNIPLKKFPLRIILQKRFHLPVIIDNDANAFTLAEATYGAGKSYRSVVGMTLGTGVGGGIVINKMIEHGRGNAGELGYVTLSMQGPRGQLGDRGSLQEYLRGKSNAMLLKKLGLLNTSSKELDVLARKRKRQARAYWDVFGRRLGIGLASIIHVLDPDVIILGGKISKSFLLFRSSTITTLRDRTIIPPPPIRRALLGDHAGMIGAALLTQKQS